MKWSRMMALAVGVVSAACSRSGDREEPAVTKSEQAADTAAMAGMDHDSMPGMNHGAAADSAGAHAGMDHGAAAPTADHSAHQATPARGAAPAADHSAHQATPARGAAPAADHSAHAAPAPARAPSGAGSATAKLQSLAAALLEDPAVRERVERDTALARLWRTEGVRQTLRPRR